MSAIAKTTSKTSTLKTSSTTKPMAETMKSFTATAPTTASPSKSRKGSRKDKQRQFQPYQHAVYKTKAKCKKFFDLLDVEGKKRLNKQEFCTGLRHIFDAENIEVSDLGIELLWEQTPKDPATNRYVSLQDFTTRFTVNKSLGLTLAPPPPKTESPKPVSTTRLLSATEVKSLQYGLFLALKGWRYQQNPVLQGKTISKKTLPTVLEALCTAERSDAKAHAREYEPFYEFERLTATEAAKVLEGLDISKPVKKSTVLAFLERQLPASKLVKPPEAVPLNLLLSRAVCSESSNKRASGLTDYTLTSVPPENVRAWVADVLFLAQRHSQPQKQLRIASDKVADAPLLAFPPLSHWDAELANEVGVSSLSDPRCATGGLVFFTNTVAICGVKSLPLSLVTERSGIRHVVYAQHLYALEDMNQGVVIQWQIRVKVYLDADERPVHIAVEDNAAWINGQIVNAEKNETFADFDFEDIPFQQIGKQDE